MSAIPQAIAVCRIYWGTDPKRHCVGCPIEPECSTPVIPLTEASLEAYQVRIEAAAKEAR